MKTILLILLFAMGPLAAATFTPEEAAREAVKRNRDLRAARHLIGEAEGRLKQAGLWANPEFDASVSRGRRQTDFSVGIMQRFPLAGRLAKARTLGRVDVAAAVAEVQVAERRLTAEVLGLARQIVVRQKRLGVLDRQAGLLREALVQTERQVAAGEAKGSEALAQEMEVARLQLEVGTLQMEQEAALAQLQTLMGREAGASLRIAGAVPVSPSPATLREAGRTARTRRPDWRLAWLQRDRSAAEEALARAQRWEDPAIGLEFSREEEMEMVGLRVSIPLPIWNRREGSIAEARAVRKRREAALGALDLAIGNEIREAQGRLERSVVLRERASGPLADLATRTTQLLLEASASGNASVLEVIASRRQQLALELTALEMEMLYVAAYTDWEWRTAWFDAGAKSSAPKRKRR